MAKRQPTVLLSTIQPVGGGVPQMVRFAAACLQRAGFTVKLAYYEPYSVSPELSVPLHRLLRLPFVAKRLRSPEISVTEFEGMHATGVGCWLPELEFTNYWQSRRWRKLIEQCDYHIAVSGSIMAALAMHQAKRPYLAWVATPWLQDRENRVGEFPWYRRWLDACVVRPVCRYLERQMVAKGTTLALSKYTQDSLNSVGNDNCLPQILTTPIDSEFFVPLADAAKTSLVPRIGFVGRFEDPRKNIALLLEAFARSRTEMPDLQLSLVGDKPSTKTQNLIHQLGIESVVHIHEHVERRELVEILQQLTAFVIPSHQEGLCIAALEAMSCAVPVISTRCGGPDNFLRDRYNGLFVDSSVASMSHAILQILQDKRRSSEYSKYARETVVEQFSQAAAERVFWQSFKQVYPTSNVSV